MNQLDGIERRIRKIIETSSTILMGTDQGAMLIHPLCESLQAYISETDSQTNDAPPEFQIAVNPTTLNKWQQQTDWEKSLLEILISTSAEFGLHFNSPPRYTLTAKNSIAADEVTIKVIQYILPSVETGAYQFNGGIPADNKTEKSKHHSFLILQGDKIIPLVKSVINIGRKSGNQIVINDLRVSRLHAQIRRIQETYVVFDVGSTGGTYVNSERINQHTLRPGDVISLAGYPMIYTEDQLEVKEKPKGKTSELKIQVHEEKR